MCTCIHRYLPSDAGRSARPRGARVRRLGGEAGWGAERMVIMCVYIYIYIHIHTYKQISIYIYTYIHMITSLYTYYYVCNHVCMNVGAYIYIYIYIYRLHEQLCSGSGPWGTEAHLAGTRPTNSEVPSPRAAQTDTAPSRGDRPRGGWEGRLGGQFKPGESGAGGRGSGWQGKGSRGDRECDIDIHDE